MRKLISLVVLVLAVLAFQSCATSYKACGAYASHQSAKTPTLNDLQ